MATDSSLLTLVEAAITQRLTGGTSLDYYMIGGKQVRYIPLPDLFAIRDKLKSTVAASTGSTRNLTRFSR